MWESTNSSISSLKKTLKASTALKALAAIGVLSGATLGLTTAALAQDEEVEDNIIVTGSYIRRGNFDSSSPINIIDQADILREARPQMGEIIRNQTYNYGTTTVDNIEGTTFQFGGFSAANLRGLGTSATLTLMDGRRAVQGNVNIIYPQIAVQRIETLLDGAAALYGTDAVAGVVNFIPFKDFEGMKVQIDYRTDDRFDSGELVMATMFGAGNDRTSLVGALEIADRKRLKRSDRPVFSAAGLAETFLTWEELAADISLPFLAGFTDQPDLNIGFNSSTNGFAPNARVPLRDVSTGLPLAPGDGMIFGSGLNFRTARDPNCGNPNFNITDLGTVGNNQSGTPGITTTVLDGNLFATESCNFTFVDIFDFIGDQERFQGYLGVQHQITDNLKIYGEIVFNRTENNLRGFLSLPVGGRTGDLVTVPGENPGNPFVASISIPDFGSNGGNPVLLPLFAVDSGDGVTPLRQTDTSSPNFDLNGDGLGDVILAGGGGMIPGLLVDPSGGLSTLLLGVAGAGGPVQTFATGNPEFPVDVLVSAAISPLSGGIPFREDVRIDSGIVAFKNMNPTPSFSKISGDDDSGPFAGTFTQSTWRFGANLEYEIPNSNWLWQGAFFYHRSEFLLNNTNINLQNTNLALQGQLLTGEIVDNVEQKDFFNPFMTSQFDSDRTNLDTGPGDPDVTTPDDPAFNSLAVIDRIFTDPVGIFSDRLITVDTFVTGDLFDLPAGTLGAALGFHYRHEQSIDNQSGLEGTDGTFVDRLELDSLSQRSVWAIFGELAVPVLDDDTFGTLQLQLAGRYEDYGDGLNTFDPKIGALWQVLDGDLSIRGSWGTSFVAPSLDQLFGPAGSFLRNSTDPLLASVRNINAGGFITTENNSNPNLIAESAETWNFGVSWEPVENLVLTADYFSFDFQDRILLLAGQANLNRNALAYLQAGNDPTSEADFTAWIEGPEKDLGIVTRDPATDLITFVSGGFRNVSAMDVSGMDFSVGYQFDGEDLGLGDIGSFSIGIQASWMMDYIFQLVSEDLSGIPEEDLEELFNNPNVSVAENPAVAAERVGRENDPSTAIPPLPEWRINGTASWNRGPHNVTTNIRFIDSVTEDGPIPGVLNEDVLGPNLKISAHTEVDLAYTYSWEAGIFGDDRRTDFTFGSINIFDNTPPTFNGASGLDTFLHDPRGRIVYVRVAQDL